MNKYAGHKQIREIAKRWNINDFDFFIDLLVSIPFMCLDEIYISSFYRIGFLIDIWLIRNLHNADIEKAELQLNLTMSFFLV
jgi:hypothetical protein